MKTSLLFSSYLQNMESNEFQPSKIWVKNHFAVF